MAVSEAYDLITLMAEGKENNYNINDCSILTNIAGDRLPVGGCVFDTYIDFIKAEAILVKFSLDEQYKYKYHPKRLSRDLYKTEELWYMILKLNNKSIEIDFIPKKIYLLEPSKLNLLNKILMINEDKLNENHADVLITE